jgi:hypothetical protein
LTSTSQPSSGVELGFLYLMIKHRPIFLGYAGHLYYDRREEQAAQEQVEAGMALSREKGFPQFLAVGMITQGWALAMQGQQEEGIAQLHQGLSPYRASRMEIDRLRFLALLATECSNLVAVMLAVLNARATITTNAT